MTTIPIQNVYYLLVYAWDVLEESESLEVVAEDCTTLAELFALMLSRGTDRVLRRGLDRGYLPRRELLSGIRGKLSFSETVKTGTLWRGKTVCEFDDLSHDVPANQIIASTLRQLMRRSDLDSGVREQVEGTCYRLSQIADVPISDHIFRTVQLHRNNREYRLLIDICRLVRRTGLTHEHQGDFTFQDFMRDEGRMRKLFERFVRNFIRYEVDWFKIEPREIKWRELRGEPEATAKLPRMYSDVHARSRSRRLVVETKFVPRLFQTGLGGKTTLRSAHLYQLHAYVSNLSPSSSLPVEAMLLYPAVDKREDLRFSIDGRAYHVATLDLNQKWRCVRRDLLELFSDRLSEPQPE